MYLRSNRLFIESAARDFRRTGAIIPSSRALATAITRKLAARSDGTLRVLEAGGGTGSITAEIIRHLASGDTLDVYEIDPVFAGLIAQRMREDRTFSRTRARIRVFNCPVEEVGRVRKYDFIISCLPFANFTPAAVREMFEIFSAVLTPGGICSFYEYIFVRKAAKIMTGRAEERERVEGVGRVLQSYIRRYEFDHEIVLRNLPPALVHHIRFTG